MKRDSDRAHSNLRIVINLGRWMLLLIAGCRSFDHRAFDKSDLVLIATPLAQLLIIFLSLKFNDRWLRRGLEKHGGREVLLAGVAFGLPGSTLYLDDTQLIQVRQNSRLKLVYPRVRLSEIKSLSVHRSFFSLLKSFEIQLHDGSHRRFFVQQPDIWVEEIERLRRLPEAA